VICHAIFLGGVNLVKRCNHQRKERQQYAAEEVTGEILLVLSSLHPRMGPMKRDI